MRVGRRAPLRRKQCAFDFCRLLSAFVIGPELERARVMLYRGGTNCALSLRLPATSGATDGFLLVWVGPKSPSDGSAAVVRTAGM